MKKSLLLLCCFLILYRVDAQKGIELNINTGFPITRIENSFDFKSFYMESNIQKPVFRNIFMGLGFNYSTINSEPFNNLITYDRNTFYYYTFIGNSFLSKNRKIDFSPQIKIGYSSYTYSMNEFESGMQSDNGFFGAPGIVVKYKMNDKVYLTTQMFYNHIFNSYKMEPNIDIPTNYLGIREKDITDFNLGIGVTYKLN